MIRLLLCLLSTSFTVYNCYVLLAEVIYWLGKESLATSVLGCGHNIACSRMRKVQYGMHTIVVALLAFRLCSYRLKDVFDFRVVSRGNSGRLCCKEYITLRKFIADMVYPVLIEFIDY